MAEPKDEMPVRVIWRMTGGPGLDKRKDRKWLYKQLRVLDKRLDHALDERGFLAQEGVSKARPLYPDGVVAGLVKGFDRTDDRVAGCLRRIADAATKVIDRRELLEPLLKAIENLEGNSEGDVEPGSVDTIMDTSVAAPPHPGSMPQPYLDDYHRGGICLDRDAVSLRGKGLTLALVEMGWVKSHPDLPQEKIKELALPAPLQIPQPGESDQRHGNHVLGILCAQRNHQGIDGVVDLCDAVQVARFGDDGTATKPSDTHVFTAMAAAIGALPRGSVLVAAVDARRPGYTNRLPLEAWSPARVVFRLAAARPVYVVTAAGNGLGVNLDPLSAVRSPAFVVGATDLFGSGPAWMSNVGTRVDLHGWGVGVVTCDGEGYTEHFGGTSSATAIVAAAAAAVVSHVLHMGCHPPSKRLPTPAELKHLLVSTGYHPLPGLGRRPDVAGAVEHLESIGCDFNQLLPADD